MRKVILNTIPFLAALVVFAGVRTGIGSPELIEKYYSQGLYPVIASIVSSVSMIFPFSLWDLFWSISVILFVTGLIAVILKKINFSIYILRSGQFLALLYALFYLFWGFNYFRQPARERLEWAKTGTGEDLFYSVFDSLISGANKNYTRITFDEYSVIDSLVEDSYFRNRINLKVTYPGGVRRPKRIMFSSVFIRSDISGYFGPLFNEVHLNGYLLPVDFPFVLAHEKAHQFGIASEAEANLAAYIVCSSSDDLRLRYSSYMHLLLYFLGDASGTENYYDYLKKIDKRVLTDLRKRSRYYASLRNRTLGKMQNKANDIYLKSNHIKKGIINYNEVVELVILWYGKGQS
jgi:hypothetical protein